MGGEDVGAGQGFTNIDVLPLGKLLQTKYLDGRKPGKRKNTVSKLKEKGYASKFR